MTWWVIMIKDKFILKKSSIGQSKRKLVTIWFLFNIICDLTITAFPQQKPKFGTTSVGLYTFHDHQRVCSQKRPSSSQYKQAYRRHFSWLFEWHNIKQKMVEWSLRVMLGFSHKNYNTIFGYNLPIFYFRDDIR